MIDPGSHREEIGTSTCGSRRVTRGSQSPGPTPRSGSNDLHRFWENSYVGHAVNMINFRGSFMIAIMIIASNAVMHSDMVTSEIFPPGGVKFPAVSRGCENHSMILTPQSEILASGSQCYTPDGVRISRCSNHLTGSPGVTVQSGCQNCAIPGCLRGDPEIVHF
jgi:hypothetical protein